MAEALPAPAPVPESRLGAGLVLAAALAWSTGGLFGRLTGGLDPWTVVFWRGSFAAGFLLAVLVARDGPRGALARFRAMGAPGLLVAACFATASSAFVVALQHTTVANILLVQAGAPLFAALIARAAFGARTDAPTWAAIAGAIVGVLVMVAPSLAGAASARGDGLALVIALAFAVAAVTTRRHAGIAMTPAAALGMALAAAAAAALAPALAVAPPALALLAGFGALNLGLGLALFVAGARLVPAPVAALLVLGETLLGPFWVWLAFGEAPGPRTLAGGGIVLAALAGHLGWQLAARRPKEGVAIAAPAAEARAGRPGRER